MRPKITGVSLFFSLKLVVGRAGELLLEKLDLQTYDRVKSGSQTRDYITNSIIVRVYIYWFWRRLDGWMDGWMAMIDGISIFLLCRNHHTCIHYLLLVSSVAGRSCCSCFLLVFFVYCSPSIPLLPLVSLLVPRYYLLHILPLHCSPTFPFPAWSL